MQRNFLNWNRVASALAALLLLTTGAGTGCGGSPDANADTPQHLPEEIVTTWKQAGAQVCWVEVSPLGYPYFLEAKEAKPGDLPAFGFIDWPEKGLAKLPEPETAFGLRFTMASVTDARLKELARLKSLQSLDLALTYVTDEGLKELAGLKNLQTLNLLHTRVTDAGLKELAGLKNLQWLNLSETKVTNAGMKELRKALPGCHIHFE